jgi:hypothetical protein
MLTGILKFFKMDYLDIVKVCVDTVWGLVHVEFVTIYNLRPPVLISWTAKAAKLPLQGTSWPRIQVSYPKWVKYQLKLT